MSLKLLLKTKNLFQDLIAVMIFKNFVELTRWSYLFKMMDVVMNLSFEMLFFSLRKLRFVIIGNVPPKDL